MTAIETLQRWVAAGGTLRLNFSGREGAAVGLCRCDGGEVVDWVHIAPHELAAVTAWAQQHVAARGSDDPNR